MFSKILHYFVVSSIPIGMFSNCYFDFYFKWSVNINCPRNLFSGCLFTEHSQKVEGSRKKRHSLGPLIDIKTLWSVPRERRMRAVCESFKIPMNLKLFRSDIFEICINCVTCAKHRVLNQTQHRYRGLLRLVQ